MSFVWSFVSERHSGVGIDVGRGFRLVAVALTGAMLAACAQTSSVTGRSASLAAGRQASLEPAWNASSIAGRNAAAAAREESLSGKPASRTQDASYGLASYYGYGQGSETASGEKFDGREMTAAHPTLPFGTRVRVTNVATGRSVTVRVNDRGPFVAGRIIDVSHSAAETLGIVGRGVAKVKVDVVE